MKKLYLVAVVLIIVVFVLPAVLLDRSLNTAGSMLILFLAFLGMMFSGR